MPPGNETARGMSYQGCGRFTKFLDGASGAAPGRAGAHPELRGKQRLTRGSPGRGNAQRPVRE